MLVLVIGFHFFDDDYEHRFAEHEHESEEREPGAGAMAAIRLRTFSLRTVLIAFLLLGAVFGITARWYHDIRQRGEMQLALLARCNANRDKRGVHFGNVLYSQEKEISWWTKQARTWMHPEYGRRFQILSLSSRLIEQEPPLRLSQLFGAEHLTVHSTALPSTLTEAFQIDGLKRLSMTFREMSSAKKNDWRVVRNARELEQLRLDGPIPFDLAEELSKLPKLSTLDVPGCTPEVLILLARTPNLTEFSCNFLVEDGTRKTEPSEAELQAAAKSFAAVFDELAKRPKLTKLTIRGRLPVGRSEIAGFCAKSSVRELRFQAARLKPECYAEFAKLLQLQLLETDDRGLLDEHLEAFTVAKQLKLLTVGPEVSGEAILQLRKKMPGCKVWRM